MGKYPSIGLGLQGLFCVLLASGVGVGQEDCPCGPSGKNGPLARLIPQEFHGADFRPACRAHDACYGSPGSCRAECDRRFRQDLLCACGDSTHPALCRFIARNMGRATKAGGARAFERAQERELP